MASAMLLVAAGASAHAQLQPEDAVRVEDVARQAGRIRRDGEVVAACSRSADCDDGLPCTLDLCSQGDCIHLSVPDCVACESTVICSAADVVFLMDTSGSMRDEAAAICASIEGIVADLADRGITVFPRVLGITQQPGIGFTCISGTVVGLLGGTVPGDAAACSFPGSISSYESWGPATAIVAARYPWGFGTTRIIIPVSDEGPCDGSLPEGCNDPGEDRNAIENAIDFAAANGVIISPIVGTGADPCTINLAQRAADATQGRLMQTKEPKLDIADAIRRIIVNDCVVNDRCDDGQPCTADDRCFDRVCRGTPIVGCRLCVSDMDCEDGSVCTVDTCENGSCVWTPGYDAAMHCCDPADGSLAVIDDGKVCTIDTCNMMTGEVAHPAADVGVGCDDHKPCTIEDVCDGQGGCRGRAIGSVSCQSDADCYGQVCDAGSGLCVCEGPPDLCLVASPSELPGEGCYAIGDLVTINVELGPSASTIVGGQFQVGYDPAVFDFVSIVPGADADPTSPYSYELLRVVNEASGRVFYAVAVPMGEQGTRGPAVLATLTFRAATACSGGEFCFVDENPQRSTLADDTGHPVPFAPCCSGLLAVDGPPPLLECPSDMVTNADAGSTSTTLTWSPVSALSSCDGPSDMACSGTSDQGAEVDKLARQGGVLPSGVSSFTCRSVDGCGATSSCDWTVRVEETNVVEVDLELSPPVTRGPLDRCIEFKFFSANCASSEVLSRTVSFGYPYNLPGQARRVRLSIPAGYYSCATARDVKHTLRSTSEMTIEGSKYVARFMGNPALGGNWLIGGNLDGVPEIGPAEIGPVDQLILETQYPSTVNPQTPCGTTGYHADFNGDGLVNFSDLMALQANLGVTEAGTCCGGVAGLGASDGLSDNGREQLELLGITDVPSADVNGDGVVDDLDVVQFLLGENPVSPLTAEPLPADPGR